MTQHLQKIIDSKRAMRRKLASRPVAEKLRMLEEMRERQVSLNNASKHAKTDK